MGLKLEFNRKGKEEKYEGVKKEIRKGRPKQRGLAVEVERGKEMELRKERGKRREKVAGRRR